MSCLAATTGRSEVKQWRTTWTLGELIFITNNQRNTVSNNQFSTTAIHLDLKEVYWIKNTPYVSLQIWTEKMSFFSFIPFLWFFSLKLIASAFAISVKGDSLTNKWTSVVQILIFCGETYHLHLGLLLHIYLSDITGWWKIGAGDNKGIFKLASRTNYLEI